jgi:hypothetical protein
MRILVYYDMTVDLRGARGCDGCPSAVITPFSPRPLPSFLSSYVSELIGLRADRVEQCDSEKLKPARCKVTVIETTP